MEFIPELQLNRQKLLCEESLLSPEKEREYLNTIADLKEEVSDLHQQLAYFKKALYGQKSEKSEIVLENAEQLTLFNEAEQEAEDKKEQGNNLVSVPTHTRKAKRTHAEILKDLPVEEITHTLDDKACPECGSEMEAIGKEFVRDEVVYIPAQMLLRKHYIEVAKCTSCGTDESKDANLPDVPSPVFRKAAAPEPMIPHSFCSPELLAHIIFEKYCQAVPLYRQEKEYAALGVSLSRTTMANWIICAADKYARPVWEAMKAELLSGNVIHADETVLQVLNEPGRKAKTDSRMWVYCSPKLSGHYNVLFQYCPTRNGDNAVNFLGDFGGYLVCDGFDGYNKLTGATRCGCFAHVRRKFVDALPSDKELLKTSKAAEGVVWCNKLFELEREYEGKDEAGRQTKPPLTFDEKQKQRQKRSKPVLDGFFAWLNSLNTSGGTKLSKAVKYALNEEKYLRRFLENPQIPIDNNRAENAIRPFVVGRKNWLFSASPKGAEASAMFYSLAVAATANGIDAEKYFAKLFSEVTPPMPW
jgi:uncharacterized protein with PIN domain